MRINRHSLLSFAVVLVFAVAVYLARDWPQQARLFPWAIGIPMLGLALIQLGIDLRNSRQTEPEPNGETGPAASVWSTINIYAWIVGLLGAIWMAGFHVAVPLIVFLYLKVQSRESWLLSLAYSGFAWMFVWGVFDRFLNLPFPQGIVVEWLENSSV